MSKTTPIYEKTHLLNWFGVLIVTMLLVFNFSFIFHVSFHFISWRVYIIPFNFTILCGRTFFIRRQSNSTSLFNTTPHTSWKSGTSRIIKLLARQAEERTFSWIQFYSVFNFRYTQYSSQFSDSVPESVFSLPIFGLIPQ